MPIVISLCCAQALAADRQNPSAQRIVSVGGTVSEILYALGAADRVVAVDSTSKYPAAADEKPDVGYMRALSPEGVLSQNPDLILLQDGAGPPEALAVLKASEVAVVSIATPPSVQTIARKIRNVGAAVGLSDPAEALAVKTQADLDALSTQIANLSQPRKRVLFVLSLANGRIMAGGKDTEAAALIETAGGINAADGITGYRPMTDEAVGEAQPDVVLVMKSGNHNITADQIFALPAFRSTPAAGAKALVQMDGLFILGFGPRTPDAVRTLAASLYPESF